MNKNKNPEVRQYLTLGEEDDFGSFFLRSVYYILSFIKIKRSTSLEGVPPREDNPHVALSLYIHTR